MIFDRPLKDAASQGTLVVSGVSLERELRVRFLGVILDECLNWRDQTQYVTDKISKYVGIFYDARSSLTVTSLILLYNSLVYSHLTYCNSVCGLAPKKYLDQLHKTQKKLVRAMSHSHYLAHYAPVMKQLSILNIYDVNSYHTCLLVFKAVQNNHNPLHSYFNFRIGLHNTRLIDQNFLSIPRINFNLGDNSISHRGSSLFNKLPRHIRECNSVISFKTAVKCSLLSDYE